jgi:hypothetical protein
MCGTPIGRTLIAKATGDGGWGLRLGADHEHRLGNGGSGPIERRKALNRRKQVGTKGVLAFPNPKPAVPSFSSIASKSSCTRKLASESIDIAFDEALTRSGDKWAAPPNSKFTASIPSPNFPSRATQPSSMGIEARLVTLARASASGQSGSLISRWSCEVCAQRRHKPRTRFVGLVDVNNLDSSWIPLQIEDHLENCTQRLDLRWATANIVADNAHRLSSPCGRACSAPSRRRLGPGMFVQKHLSTDLARTPPPPRARD